VFVDPVGTGYSHAMGEKKDKDFWGYDEDADSVAEFIRTYITTHNRWNSPKFLLGESYGGIRSAMLVSRLQQNLDIGLNGVILISPALNMGTLPFVVAGNDLSYATHLPALAATAYYHKKLPDSWPSERALLDEVEAYAGSEYLQALVQGRHAAAGREGEVAERLHRYTGLSKDYILRSDLRIYAIRFIKELLRAEGKSVGLLDGRYVQDELDRIAEFPDGDAFNAKTAPIYIALFQSYLRNDLKVDVEKRYVGSNGEANQAVEAPGDGTGAFSASSTSPASSPRAPRTARRCASSAPRATTTSRRRTSRPGTCCGTAASRRTDDDQELRGRPHDVPATSRRSRPCRTTSSPSCRSADPCRRRLTAAHTTPPSADGGSHTTAVG
jgi:hypothetical protein